MKMLSRLDKAILLYLIAAIPFYFVYNLIIKSVMLKAYSSAYFIYSEGSHFKVMLFLIYALVAVIILFSGEKLANKRNTIISVLLGIVVFIVTVVLSTNVWVADSDAISYNTLFKQNKEIYYYNDIENIELQTELTGLRIGGESLVYEITAKDGKSIDISIFEAFYSDDSKLIDFDKAIAEKRKTVGEYSEFSVSNELNNYFSAVFN